MNINKNQNDAFSATLDLVRWFAAFLVVIAHSRHLLFVDYKNISAGHSLFMKGFYFLTGLGHESVILFFVLSGYLVGGTALIRLFENKWNFKEYFINRFSRIYTVLFPALVLGGLLDFIGTHYVNQSQIYTNVLIYNIGSLNSIIANQLNFTTFFGNLLNLQTIAVPRLGSNQPLWSLANEWWYYMLFGLFANAYFFRGQGKSVAFFSAGVGLVLFYFLPSNIQLWFAIWMLGALTSLVNITKFRLPVIVSFLILIVGMAVSRLSHSDDGSGNVWVDLLRDSLLAICFCFVLIQLKAREFVLPAMALHPKLASFSYTVYLIHFPILIFLTALHHDVLGLKFFVQPSLLTFAIFIANIIVIYAIAWFFAVNTEFHYRAVSKWLKTKCA